MAGVFRLYRNVHQLYYAVPKQRVFSSFTFNTSAGSCDGFGKLFEHSVFTPKYTNYRSTTNFLTRTTAEDLWRGVTSVSAAGKKKGRGKRGNRRIQFDLNRGQVIGFGKKNMLWPGLNSPVVRGREVVTQKELPPDELREKRILELRNRLSSSRFPPINPLERGWSGRKMPGRSIGPPDPVGDETFEGFDSRVLEFKSLVKMTGKGRVRTFSAFVVIGNKNGIVGFGLGKSSVGTTAANKARNQAANCLRYIERYEDHTVLHNFISTFGAVTVIAKKQREGFGLVCHRCVKAICEMIGIKNLYAKVKGPTRNKKNVTKAFIIGLMRQKSLQKIAEEKGLHVVELYGKGNHFPKVVASPSKCRSKEDISINEIMDFNLYVSEGKVHEPMKAFEPFYINWPSYLKRLKDHERFRNREEVAIQLIIRYGARESFLTIREKEKAEQELKEMIEARE